MLDGHGGRSRMGFCRPTPLRAASRTPVRLSSRQQLYRPYASACGPKSRCLTATEAALGWVSAAQLRCAPPLGHLFAYLLASNFIVPMQVPAALKADA